MPPTPEPRLAPPGAGLPFFELLIARILFRRRVRTGNSAAFTARFVAERERIRGLVRDCAPPRGARRVLIRRVRGLEDSSRYWSVAMTLDHLRIVNGEMAKVIRALTAGTVPPGRASTAAVKPDPGVSMAVAPLYEESCDTLLAAVANVPSQGTEVKFPHPWFGPMDASAWHALSGSHMAIHRVQIERILTDPSEA